MNDKILIRRTRAYKAIMSTGDPVKLEQEELNKVIASANQKGLVIVKRGMINPAYLVAIVEDGERMEVWGREKGYSAEDDDGRRQGDKARERGLKPLACIFDGKIAEQLQASAVKSAKELGMSVDAKLLDQPKQDHEKTK